MDDADSLFTDIEEGKDIAFGLLRNGDDSICHLKRGLFHPEAEIVASAELLTLPRAERFQRVNRDDKRNTVVQLGHDAAQVGVPRVAVDQIGGDPRPVKINATARGPEWTLKRLGTLHRRCPSTESPHGKIAQIFFLLPEATDLDLHQLGQLTAQVVDMNTGTSVDVGWVFVGEKKGFHEMESEVFGRNQESKKTRTGYGASNLDTGQGCFGNIHRDARPQIKKMSDEGTEVGFMTDNHD